MSHSLVVNLAKAAKDEEGASKKKVVKRKSPEATSKPPLRRSRGRNAPEADAAFFIDNEAVEVDSGNEEPGETPSDIYGEIENDQAAPVSSHPYTITEEPYEHSPEGAASTDIPPEGRSNKLYKITFSDSENTCLEILNGKGGYVKVQKKFGSAVLQQVQFFYAGVKALYKKIRVVREAFKMIRAGRSPDDVKVNLIPGEPVSAFVSPRYPTINVADFTKDEDGDKDSEPNIPLKNGLAFAFCDFVDFELPQIFPSIAGLIQVQP